MDNTIHEWHDSDFMVDPELFHLRMHRLSQTLSLSPSDEWVEQDHIR